MSTKEAWGSRIGLILAMAGNAIGLGNFLRFPRQAALNGGGAFMIPYIVALLLLGIPLMWVEWSMGRYGGQFGHSNTIGIFDKLWRNRTSKYLGTLGVTLPLLLVTYYMVIESWTFAYAFFSISKGYFGIQDMTQMNAFLRNFQGVVEGEYFSGLVPIIIFWIITVAINTWVISRGISGGIEKLAKIAMPLLFILAIILIIRVFTLGAPDPTHPENSVAAGLAYIWNPDFSRLGDMSVWLAAAGQIFFTLSIGMGTIACYSSYCKKDDDVALTGLTTSMTNEFAEIVLGGSIAIPIAVAFFGLAVTQEIATEGSFNLGFVAMPIIFQKLPLGFIFATFWFALLFFAGVTSSVALTQPFMAFLQDELNITRRKAAIITGAISLIFGLPIILWLKTGYLDQYDFWIGTVGIVAFAFLEVILFTWAFGGKRMWDEMRRGAEIKIPRIFYYIIRFVAPVYLMILLVGWVWQDLASPASNILLKNTSPEARPYLWLARASMLILVVVLPVVFEWARRKKRPPFPPIKLRGG